jgi:hypothetical protein
LEVPFHNSRAEALLAIRLHYDSERSSEHQQHGQVLVYRKLLIPIIPGGCSLPAVVSGTGTNRLLGIYSTLRARVWFPIRARDLQMALVVAGSERETADHLGI